MHVAGTKVIFWNARGLLATNPSLKARKIQYLSQLLQQAAFVCVLESHGVEADLLELQATLPYATVAFLAVDANASNQYSRVNTSGVLVGAVGCITLCGGDGCVVPGSVSLFVRRCCTLAFSPVFDRELVPFFVPEV